MSFQQGLSGLNAASKNLDVIGNNIANASTFGIKAVARRVRRRLRHRAQRRRRQPDRHRHRPRVGVAAVHAGQHQTTDNPMDLAINGGGFFQLTDGNSPVTYTRNGQFKIDRDGYIVNNQAAAPDRLSGRRHRRDPARPGRAAAAADRRHRARRRPRAIDMELNLDSRRRHGADGRRAFDFADADTYNNATSLDGLRRARAGRRADLYFQKAATDTWNVYVTANGTPSRRGGSRRRSTTMSFQANGGTPTAPIGPDQLNIPAPTTRPARARCRSRHRVRRWPAPPSSARISA